MRISNELRVGIMFLTGLILFVLIIVTLTRWGQNRGTYTITMYFKQAQGIQEGASVRVAGVEVGRVTSVGFDNVTNRAMVTARVSDKVKLYENYHYTIGIGGLVGERFVEIVPVEGDRGAELVNGSIVDGSATPDMNDVLASANTLINKVGTTMDSLNQIFANPQNQQNFQQALENLNKSAQSAAAFSESLNRIARSNERSVDLMIANLEDVSSDIREISDSLTPQLANNKIISNLEQASASAARVVKRFEGVSGSIEDFLGDGAITADMKATLASVRKASEDLQLVLEDVRATTKVLPKVTSNIEQASADLPQITKPFREVAPETAENIREISRQLRTASESVGGLVQRVSKTAGVLGALDVKAQARVMGLTGGDQRSRAELNLDVKTGSSMLRLGAVNVDNDTRMNVQVGSKLQDNLWLRYGLVQSHPGVGLDYTANRNLLLTGELFDPSHLRGNLTADLKAKPLGDDWWFSVGWYDIFQRDSFGLGLTYRP